MNFDILYARPLKNEINGDIMMMEYEKEGENGYTKHYNRRRALGRAYCLFKCMCVRLLSGEYPCRIWRGQKDGGAIKGVIVCGSEADARRCEQAITDLIMGGYREPFDWLVALDMADLLKDVFTGMPLNYWHMEIDSSNVDEATARLVTTVASASTVFHYTSVCELEDELAMKIGNAGSEAVSRDAVAVLYQVSCHKGKKEAPAALDVWYRGKERQA